MTSLSTTGGEPRLYLMRHGKPIQYAHVEETLAMRDVWTPIAALPVAFEPPSAGFALDWRLLATLRDRGVGFVLARAGCCGRTARTSSATRC